MPSKKSYNRFFIIMQEDQKGYGVDANKVPSGYAKLEMRNDRAKMSFYVQDIKKQSGPYYMVLIAQGNGGTRELINLGQINIDEGGKADVSNEHEANNIANTNIGMDKVQGAGICRINGTKINPVMVGFICGEELKNWATYPMAKGGAKVTKTTTMKTTKTTTIIEMPSEEMAEKEAKKEVKVVEEKRVESGEARADKKERVKEAAKSEDINSHKDEVKSEGEAQNFDEYEEQIERLKEYRRKHNSKQCDDDNEKHDHHDHHDHDDKNDNPVGPMGEFFKNVIKGLEKIGVKDSIKNCTWYKAQVENLDAMYCENDYNKYSVIFYPMICYYPYIAKSKHFMVGYKCDDEGALKYIIYAIPGTKELIDQPYEGKTGFVTFMSDSENCEKGHWLMYYDVKKNSVVVPVKTSK